MGALAGFRYRDVIKRLRHLGLEFHRQAAGSHEIWFNPVLNRYTTIPNHPGVARGNPSRHPQAGRCRCRIVLAAEVSRGAGSRPTRLGFVADVTA
jgi:predicted RNA binding protein YcfA (HicA-like mRNA interferase family)